MTSGLLFSTVLMFFVSEVICDREIILQSRFRVAAMLLGMFLVVWVFAQIISNQPVFSPIMDAVMSLQKI